MNLTIHYFRYFIFLCNALYFLFYFCAFRNEYPSCKEVLPTIPLCRQAVPPACSVQLLALHDRVAVDAAVLPLLAIRQPEDMRELLLNRGDTAGVLTV